MSDLELVAALIDALDPQLTPDQAHRIRHQAELDHGPVATSSCLLMLARAQSNVLVRKTDMSPQDLLSALRSAAAQQIQS